MQVPSPDAGQAGGLAGLPDRMAALLKQLRTGSGGGLRVEPSAKEKLDGDWKLVIQALRQLQPMLTGSPKVQSFDFARDEGEVSVKVQGAQARPSYLILSRRHPTDRNAAPDRVWLSSPGAGETGFDDASAALVEFTRRIVAALG